MARYVAKNIVKSGLAKKCEIQISYAIGVSKPVSIYINTFNTSIVEESVLLKAVNSIFDFTPQGIIDTLHLKEPIYSDLSHYGHFGREDLNVQFEKTDKVDELLKKVKEKNKE